LAEVCDREQVDLAGEQVVHRGVAGEHVFHDRVIHAIKLALQDCIDAGKLRLHVAERSFDCVEIQDRSRAARSLRITRAGSIGRGEFGNRRIPWLIGGSRPRTKSGQLSQSSGAKRLLAQSNNTGGERNIAQIDACSLTVGQAPVDEIA